MTSNLPISLGIAGSTAHTLLLAQALFSHPAFALKFILTSAPKPSGRLKIVAPNPLHTWAISNHIPVVEIREKIESEIQTKLEDIGQPDLLLVADFGYWIPSWLLNWPLNKCINVHPSDLPRWRGSSPGQFVLFNQEKRSAVSIIQMTEKLDQGPILAKLPFAVDPTWTQADYYDFSYQLTADSLPDILSNFMSGNCAITSQPDISPTPLARRLMRNDGFLPWQYIHNSMNQADTQPKSSDVNAPELGLLAQTLAQTEPHLVAQQIVAAVRAFSPWPGVWTEGKTHSQTKRMKILSASMTATKLKLEQVQIEGKRAGDWTQIKNAVQIKTTPTLD